MGLTPIFSANSENLSYAPRSHPGSFLGKHPFLGGDHLPDGNGCSSLPRPRESLSALPAGSRGPALPLPLLHGLELPLKPKAQNGTLLQLHLGDPEGDGESTTYFVRVQGTLKQWEAAYRKGNTLLRKKVGFPTGWDFCSCIGSEDSRLPRKVYRALVEMGWEPPRLFDTKRFELDPGDYLSCYLHLVKRGAPELIFKRVGLKPDAYLYIGAREVLNPTFQT